MVDPVFRKPKRLSDPTFDVGKGVEHAVDEFQKSQERGEHFLANAVAGWQGFARGGMGHMDEPKRNIERYMGFVPRTKPIPIPQQTTLNPANLDKSMDLYWVGYDHVANEDGHGGSHVEPFFYYKDGQGRKMKLDQYGNVIWRRWET